jgi:hypothetical protein
MDANYAYLSDEDMIEFSNDVCFISSMKQCQQIANNNTNIVKTCTNARVIIDFRLF